MNIIRPKATAVKCGVAPITIHRWATDPKYFYLKFPKKLRLSENSVGFIEDEIDEWIAERAARRAGDENATAA